MALSQKEITDRISSASNTPAAVKYPHGDKTKAIMLEMLQHGVSWQEYVSAKETIDDASKSLFVRAIFSVFVGEIDETELDSDFMDRWMALEKGYRRARKSEIEGKLQSTEKVETVSSNVDLLYDTEEETLGLEISRIREVLIPDLAPKLKKRTMTKKIIWLNGIIFLSIPFLYIFSNLERGFPLVPAFLVCLIVGVQLVRLSGRWGEPVE